MVDCMALLKPDAMVGHWEFTLGAERVKEIVDRLGFPFLGQNIRDTEWDEAAFKPMTMIERGGVKIAVIGQAFPYTPIANPRWMIPELVVRHPRGRSAAPTSRRRARTAPARRAAVAQRLRCRPQAGVAGEGHRRDPDRAHPRRAARRRCKVGKTLLVASGSHGKFVSRLDLDVQGGEVKGYRFRLIPVFADAIAPDAEMAARSTPGSRAARGDAGRSGRTHRHAALPPRQFQRHARRRDLRRAARRARCRDRAVARLPLGRLAAAGQDITREDIYNATAITYPNAYRMTMTGARLKEILEDVADNLFNPDPYYQQGGDMVRVGGLSYTIDIGKPGGAAHLRPDAAAHRQAARRRAGLRRRRMGQRQRRHRRSADLGRGDEPSRARRRGGSEGAAECARDRRCKKHLAKHMHTYASVKSEVGGRRQHEDDSGDQRRGFVPAGAARGAALDGRRARRAPRRQRLQEIRRTSRRNVPDWSRKLGDGVAVRDYGKPSRARGARHSPRRRMAHRLARKLGQLHAAARARRHHHAERAVLRAPSFRYRRGRPGRLSTDPARPRRQAADLHARRHQAHAARQPRLFLRMRGEFRHGMARRAAQRLPVHPRHGALRDVYRRAAEDAARGSRRQDRTRNGCCSRAAMPPR